MTKKQRGEYKRYLKWLRRYRQLDLLKINPGGFVGWKVRLY